MSGTDNIHVGGFRIPATWTPQSRQQPSTAAAGTDPAGTGPTGSSAVATILESPPCRSFVSFAGAGVRCQSVEHLGTDQHEACVSAQFSANTTWTPERGKTTVKLTWSAPVEGVSLDDRARAGEPDA